MEYTLKNAKFIMEKGEYCYKEVLDDFENAEYINVLTYNISEKNIQNALLDKLKEAGQCGVSIKFVTNIPNRWNMYWSEYFRNKAQKSIMIYLSKLSPEKFGSESTMFFNFDNHGKIVMTNNIIYWGSSNYSEESKNNYECGTISRDPDFIKFVNEKVFPSIIGSSISYYENKAIYYITNIKSSIDYLESITMEIYYASFGSYQDYGTNFETVEYYDILNNSLSWRVLDNLMTQIKAFGTCLKELPNSLLEDSPESDVDYWDNYLEIEEILENYAFEIDELNFLIEDLCYDLEDMAKYNVDIETNRILSDKYGNVAYDEYLDFYMDLAYDEAKSVKDELVEDSECTIRELVKSLNKYEDELRQIVDYIIDIAKKFPSKTINPIIDNTR